MTRRTRRLAGAVATLALATSLAGCGENNPFGSIVRGEQPQAPTAAEAEPSPDSTDATYEAGTYTPTPGTPSESSSPDASTPSGPMTGTETSTGGPALPAPGVTPTTTAGTATSTSTSRPSPRAVSPTVTGTTVQVDGRTIAGMPPGLGFPSGTSVEATNSFAPASGTVVLSAPDEAALFSHYRSVLASAGYRVVSDAAGTMTFTGQGFRGSLVGMGPQGGVLTWAPSSH